MTRNAVPRTNARDVDSLVAMYDYFIALSDVATAWNNQPRAENLGDVFDKDHDLSMFKAQEIVDLLKAIKPTAQDERARAHVLIDWTFRCDDFPMGEPGRERRAS